MSSLNRRHLLGGYAALLTAASPPGSFPAWAEAAKREPSYLGVSGPLPVANAPYCSQWKRGFDLAVAEVNGDRGRSSNDILVKAAQEYGAEIVAVEGYIPDEKDLRSPLVRVRDAKPDGLMLLSYYSDAALIARQVKQAGLKLPIVAASSVYS